MSSPITPPDRVGVHVEHCCARHGCKYGDAACPVALRQRPQAYPCEFCEDNPPERTVLVVEAVAEAREEDSGQALILEINPDDDAEHGEFVRLHSWHPTGRHHVLRPLTGRRLKITFELADDCPRCGQPLDKRPAVSRSASRAKICTACGTDEGLRAQTGEPLPEADAWPVVGRWRVAQKGEQA